MDWLDGVALHLTVPFHKKKIWSHAYLRESQPT